MVDTKSLVGSCSLVCSCSLAGTSACKNCPNFKAVFGEEWTITTYNDNTDVSEEAVKPVLQYWCPKCDALVGKYSNYCHNCGVKLDWNEEE